MITQFSKLKNNVEMLLMLTADEIHTSIKLEAIERGIDLPLKLSECIKNHGVSSFSIDSDALSFFELVAPGEYQSTNTGICFKTLEEANNALKNAIAVVSTGYGETAKNKIIQADFAVKQTWVSLRNPSNYNARIVEHVQDTSKFDELCKECMTEYALIKQEKYDDCVKAAKQSQYLELANGDTTIAKKFWKKLEQTEWM
jgi:hypothetical protein